MLSAHPHESHSEKIKTKQTQKNHTKNQRSRREEKKKKMWKCMKDEQTMENFGFEVNSAFWQALKLSYLQ